MEAPPGVLPLPRVGKIWSPQTRARADSRPGPGRLSVQRGRPSSKQPLPTRRALQEDGTVSGGGSSSLGRVLTLRHACLPSMESVTSSEPWGGRSAVGHSGAPGTATPPPQPLASENLRLRPAPHLPRPQPPPPLLSPGSARGRQALSQARVGPVQLTWQGKKQGWGGQQPASYLQPAQ